MSDAITVVIADDQRVVRDGLTMLVGVIDGIEVVATAEDGAQALAAAERHHPDVVLMDLKMPNMDGTEATRRLAELHPEIEVLVLTTYAGDETLLPALQAGARGYLTKDASAEQIEAAIRDVSAGLTHLDPDVQERLVALAVSSAPRTGGDQTADLTPRESEVLALIADGLSNGEIAERLVVSNATVKTHVNRIFAKIGARDRAQAVRFAYERGLSGRTAS